MVDALALFVTENGRIFEMDEGMKGYGTFRVSLKELMFLLNMQNIFQRTEPVVIFMLYALNLIFLILFVKKNNVMAWAFFNRFHRKILAIL